MSEQRFSGTERYVATEDLTTAVNAAVTVGRPILIKGEPGTGKTQLAEEIARGLNRPLLQWHVKSTTKAQHRPFLRIPAPTALVNPFTSTSQQLI